MRILHKNGKLPWVTWICLFSCTFTVVHTVPFHDFISNLSDQVNEIKRAFINIGNPSVRSSRSSTFDIASPLLTDRFVSRNPNNIRFRLYDERLSPDSYKELRIGEVDLFSTIRKTKPVKVLVHGFNHNGTEGSGSFPEDAKNAYLENTDNNVIIVDWGDLAKPRASGLSIDVFYPIVVSSNVPRVGEEIGKLLVFMLEKELIDHPDQVHIIGFSLGAHVAGVAGMYFKQITDRFIGRITGLDPASPMFEHASEIERLDKTDADFVDVIHSSRLGLQDRIGHVDFYVNGGRFQVDCYNLNDRNPRQIFSDFTRAIMGSCGHSRAPLYYIHSIKSGPGSIMGCGCSSWREYLATCRKKCKGTADFGEFCPATSRGVFFLQISVEDVNKT